MAFWITNFKTTKKQQLYEKCNTLITLVCAVLTAQTTLGQKSSFDSIIIEAKAIADMDKAISMPETISNDTLVRVNLGNDFYLKVRINPRKHEKDHIIFGQSWSSEPFYIFYRDGSSKMFAVKKEPGIHGIHKEQPFSDTTERNRLMDVIKVKLNEVK